MKFSHVVTPDLDTLIGLFHDSADALGAFREVEAADMPGLYRELLAHEHHMTVTVENHHNTPVDVKVVDRRINASHYARQIVLTRQTDGQVVQYGIMRAHLASLAAEVRTEIESEAVPLGRILIRHDVLRRIHLFSLWEVRPSRWLADILKLESFQPIYGRTALIYCNHEPAIELLEIVQ